MKCYILNTYKKASGGAFLPQNSADPLPIVHIDQEDRFSCAPICVKMVLNYVSQDLGINIPNLDLNDIRRIVRTQADGTLPYDVARINQKLRPASHRVEFIPSEGNSFHDIEEELEGKRPVIAWILKTVDNIGFYHAVVITHVDKDRLIVGYDDPMFGKQEYPVPSFLNDWEECENNLLIRLSIDRKPPQKELEDFPHDLNAGK